MDHAGSSGDQPAEQYVSPLSADDMVTLATILLRAPSRGNKIQEIHMHMGGWFDIDDMLETVKDEVHAACRHRMIRVADVCATGVALALLSLCGIRWLNVKCDDAGEEAVAAFYAGLEHPSCAVEELIICGAAFGTRAAAARPGQCLNVNSTIRQLTILDVACLCDKEAWTAFSDALTSNATLLGLELEPGGGSRHGPGNCSHVVATLADSHKLSALREVSIHDLRPTMEDMQGWGTMLKHNLTITKFKLCVQLQQGSGLLVPLCEALLTNTTLQTLIIECAATPPQPPQPQVQVHVEEVTSTDDDTLTLATMLRTNRSLTYLDIMSSGILCKASLFDQGMSQNNTLEKLHICVDVAGAHALMTALTTLSATTSNARPHLKSLWLGDSYQVSASFPTAVALGDMLASNETLTQLGFYGAPYSNEEWATTILPAPVNNHSLQHLILKECPGVDSGLVYDALLELLDSNTSITYMDLRYTPLHQEGKAQAVKAVLEANKEYRAALKNVPTVVTTSCRLVLCGYPFAGKSTLMQTMIRRHSCGAPTPTQRTRGMDIQRVDN